MKNAMTICCLSRQMKRQCERIDELTMDLESVENVGNDDLVEELGEQRLECLEQMQRSLLMLTGLIAESVEEKTANADDSAFMEGELTATKSEVAPPEEETEA